MTTVDEMTEDVALVLLSNDLSKKYRKVVMLDSWPTPDEMSGAAFVAKDVRIDWAENIKRIYRNQAEPLVLRLRSLGYGHKEP
jgi:hypothetical protein